MVRYRPSRRSQRPHEEYAYVLDYMPMGNPSDRHPFHRNKPVTQLIGEDYFMLLEATPRYGASVEIGERVYIGPEEELRIKIFKVDAEIVYDDLTSVARENLPQIVEKIVKSKEQVFVEFFNVAEPITLRFHSLELLPGIGKKTLLKILEQREVKPFTSFEDIKERVKIDPVKIITSRIVSELKGEEKYYLFVRPPKHASEEASRPIFLNYLERLYSRLKAKHEGSAG